MNVRQIWVIWCLDGGLILVFWGFLPSYFIDYPRVIYLEPNFKVLLK